MCVLLDINVQDVTCVTTLQKSINHLQYAGDRRPCRNTCHHESRAGYTWVCGTQHKPFLLASLKVLSACYLSHQLINSEKTTTSVLYSNLKCLKSSSSDLKADRRG